MKNQITPEPKQVSPLYRAAQITVGLIGVVIAWALVVNTWSAVQNGGAQEKEGAAKVEASLEELRQIRCNNPANKDLAECK